MSRVSKRVDSEPTEAARISPSASDRILRHPLFQGADRQRLAGPLQSLRPRLYVAGETVALPGSRRPVLQLILSGRLCLFDLTPDGRRLILDYVEAGGFDGYLAVAGLRGHFSEAMVPTEVVSISRSLLDQLLLAEPRLALNLLWSMSRRLHRREDQVERMCLRDPTQRLAAQLLALAEAIGQRQEGWWVTPRLSHVEYFWDHVRLERMLFDGVLEPNAGQLRPDQARPGLGLELKMPDAERYLVA